VDRVALEDRCELLEVDCERPELARAAIERVGELGVAVEAAPAESLRALARERVRGICEQAVAGELEDRVDVALVDGRADRRNVAARHGAPQLGQGLAIPGAHDIHPAGPRARARSPRCRAARPAAVIRRSRQATIPTGSACSRKADTARKAWCRSGGSPQACQPSAGAQAGSFRPGDPGRPVRR
jgi:hypothetical protein